MAGAVGLEMSRGMCEAPSRGPPSFDAGVVAGGGFCERSGTLAQWV